MSSSLRLKPSSNILMRALNSLSGVPIRRLIWPGVRLSLLTSPSLRILSAFSGVLGFLELLARISLFSSDTTYSAISSSERFLPLVKADITDSFIALESASISLS